MVLLLTLRFEVHDAAQQRSCPQHDPASRLFAECQSLLLGDFPT